ncbi:MAG: ferrous iron transport protein B, partial [Deltaproteobacteria bacterium]|nr:ferrous iron transport protein B [Deltaproteobacteria bacterium]
MASKISVALAGQPNCGKSTVFNALTGARQHVANYPGVTVEKKTGSFKQNGQLVEVIDLPGTYSLTSYSLEETLAREYIVEKKPEILVNIVDAANLKRNLYLTVQLMETERPLVLALNMMDVAKRRGISVDVPKLGEALGLTTVAFSAKSGRGLDELKAVMASKPDCAAICPHCVKTTPFKLDYGPLETQINTLINYLSALKTLDCPPRWLALKLLEADENAQKSLTTKYPEMATGLLKLANELRAEFTTLSGLTPERHIAFSRHKKAGELARDFQTQTEPGKKTLSDKIDQAVCHRVLGPIILLAILFGLYQISIVYGGALAAKIWPFWAKGQDLVGSLLPDPGFLADPLAYSLGQWLLKSLGAILNYIPIFVLLFALIAILEDSGYMPRMAFLLDRLFRRYGLHGQSTLPLILGGVYVGGCAIPAVMATRAIPDEKARLATIIIAPMMNCLAKVPLYLILIGAFFSTSPLQSSLAMFFIATVTLLMALPAARFLTLTVLKGKPSAPFILELPPYHVPGARTVLIRTIERIWLFIKKIVSVVLVVAIVVFGLISYPGLNAERQSDYQNKATEIKNAALKTLVGTPLEGQVESPDIEGLIVLDEKIKAAKRGVSDQAKADAIEADFSKDSPRLYGLLKGSGPGYAELKKGLRKVTSERKKLRRAFKEETFQSSVLGVVGRALEPITSFAGFDWRINIALLSAFAAKENSAATLGA